MSNQDRVISQTQVLINDVQNLTELLKQEDLNSQKIALDKVKESLFSLEILIAEDSAGIKEVLDAVKASKDNRNKIVQEALAKSLSQEERDKIAFKVSVCAQKENELLGIASTLSIKLINDVVKNIQEPAKRISTATVKVQKAINKLEDLNKQIGLLKSLIDIFNAIITAVTNGVPALIGTLLDNIDTLTKVP